jgi:glutamate synthase (NADPH/NADH) small chain
MGGMCARVCPTEVLCEQACVRNTHEDRPVRIGLLQRYATDAIFDAGVALFETRTVHRSSHRDRRRRSRGLSCAHRLALLGHSPTVFEPKEKLGGLNEYGIAAYKTPDDFAAREVDYILGLGGIEVRTGEALGKHFSLAELRAKFDAVFLGFGLAGVNDLGLDHDEIEGVANAVDYIETLRQTTDKAALPVGRKIVVIGGGMTAIDIAVQSKALGAEEVTIVYRRGREQMNASRYEQEFAQVRGVTVRFWSSPRKLKVTAGRVRGVELETTRIAPDGRLEGTGETLALEADVIFKAIGQKVLWDRLGDTAEIVALKHGRIMVDEERTYVDRGCLGRRRLRRRWHGSDRVGRARWQTRRDIHRQVPARDAARWREVSMADLTSEFLGIKSPNPFWLASAPPTDKAYNVNRAFEAGWGGAVWKTLGEDPPIVNVNGPRYGAMHGNDRRVLGFNNIELITDRPLHVNLAEIRQIKHDWPDRALIVSVMLPMNEAELGEIRADDRGHRRRRPRAQLRVSARHVRARHGLGRGPGARVHPAMCRVVQEIRECAGDREAHA